MASGRNFFYRRLTITDEAFDANKFLEFGFQATRIMMVNDHAESTLSFSFRINANPNLDGEILGPCDGPIAFDELGVGKVWFHKGVGDEDTQVRVWAWRGGSGA